MEGGSTTRGRTTVMVIGLPPHGDRFKARARSTPQACKLTHDPLRSEKEIMYRRISRTIGLGVVSSALGLLAVAYIVWFFGTAEFAVFTITMAKLSLVLLGLEVVPGSFSIFRMQEDQHFAQALAQYYLSFAVLASLITTSLAYSGFMSTGSKFVIAYAFLAVMQQYLELKVVASGTVGAFGLINTVSSAVRLLALVIFGSPALGQSSADAIWASLCLGTIAGQLFVLLRFPMLQQDLFRKGPVESARRLIAGRSEFYPYILNSMLKRLRDTFVPLFCDLVMSSKAEIGQLLVYMRALQSVMGQVRTLEAFMINRVVRAQLRRARRRIFWILAPIGHASVVVVALFLIFREGIGVQAVMMALLAGAFTYPYLAELFWRSDALASYRPQQVTISLLAFVAGMTVPPLVALMLGTVSGPLILASYVLGQTLSAVTYRLFAQPGLREGTQAE